MRRLISIFLFLIMLIISIRPIMSMHFCHGEMTSVHFFKIKGSASCCGSDNMEAPTNEQATQPDQGHHKGSSSALHFVNNSSCCSIEELYVSTDSFNPQPEQVIAKQFSGFVFLETYIRSRLSLRTREFLVKSLSFSPPDKLRWQTITRLAFICTFQI